MEKKSIGGGEKIDINTPMKPKNRVRKSDGTMTYTCGRCEFRFVQSSRCPELHTEVILVKEGLTIRCLILITEVFVI